MMDFESRVIELNKYIPILEGFISKLSGDPTKASHVQSIKNVKSLLTERLLTESNIDKCEAVLRKLDQMHKNEYQENMLQERINKLTARYCPFLENCILKLEKCELTPKIQSHLKTIRTLLVILAGRRLTHDNIDICEMHLQQLDEKVEKNTIDRIRSRIESDIKKNELTAEKKNQSSSKKTKVIPYEDTVVLDLTTNRKIYNKNSFEVLKDPRIENKEYIERDHQTNKVILLEVITPYTNSTLGNAEDRLALRYKPKKKQIEPMQDNLHALPDLPTPSKSSSFDNLSLTFMNATMSYSSVSTASMHRTLNNAPQMVPPPAPVNNQAYADIVQQLCGEFNALQQPQQQTTACVSTVNRYTKSSNSVWDSNVQFNHQQQTYSNTSLPGASANFMSNSLIPNSILPIQNSILPFQNTPGSSNTISNRSSDPRLNRNTIQSYDPVAALEQPIDNYNNEINSRNSGIYNERETRVSRDYHNNYRLSERDPRRRDSIAERRPRTPSPERKNNEKNRHGFGHSDRNSLYRRSPDRNSSYRRSPDRKIYDKRSTDRKNYDKRSPDRKNYDRRSPDRKNYDKRSPDRKNNERTNERRSPDRNRRNRAFSPKRDKNNDWNKTRNRSPERKRSPIQTFDNENSRKRSNSPEENWDNLCKNPKNKSPIKERRDSDTASQTSEISLKSSQTSTKSNTSISSSKDKSSLNSKPAGSFKIPKLKGTDRKSSSDDNRKLTQTKHQKEPEKSPKSSLKQKEPEKSPKSSLKQKDFAAELEKLDKPVTQTNKKKTEEEIDENSLLEQLSKRFGVDSNKIKSMLEKETNDKKIKNIDTEKNKKPKRNRIITSDDEDKPLTKLKEPKIEPPELERQTISHKKNEKKKRSVSNEAEFSPQLKKIKKEPVDSEAEQQSSHEEPLKPQSKVSPNNKNKKKKSELDKLNEDIDNMFIRDGVLHATGRRHMPIKQIPKNNTEETIYGISVKKCFVLLNRLTQEEISVIKNQKNFTINESLKNTDVNYHLQDKRANTCLLCKYTGINIVEHYLKKHQNKEVYLSRFNPKIAKSVKDNPIAKNATLCSSNVYNNNAKIKLQCPFCQQDMNTNQKQWKSHLMQHTGEFKCKNCNVFDAFPSDSKKYRQEYPHKPCCKGAKKFTIDDLNFHSHGLDAFMCTKCNYVQLTEENMTKHINNEHDNIQDVQSIRFLIIGFNMGKPPITDIQNFVIKNKVTNRKMENVGSSEHTYATNTVPMPIVNIKTEPLNEVTSTIPSVEVKIEPKQLSDENKSSFSIDHNNKNKLKVWSSKPSMKTEKAIENMLTSECLYSFYKCMHPKCAYFTNNKDLMDSHLQGHLSDTVECCYCDIATDSIKSYFTHMEDTHKGNVYQCAYCFYRSVAASNVVTHENHYHRQDPNKVLLCPGRPSLLVNELEQICASRAKYVPPFVCSICFEKTYIQQEFMSHLNMHKERVIKCQSCSSMVSKHQIIQHMLIHRIGLYECVYCFYGTMSLDSIRLHMATVHPTKLLYVTKRMKRSVKDEVLDLSALESTELTPIGQTVDKAIILYQQPTDVTKTKIVSPESLCVSPSKGQLKSSLVENIPKISNVLSFGESLNSANTVKLIPNNITSPTQLPKVISPNSKLILQSGSTSYTPGAKVIIKTVGTNQPGSMKVIKMADGKFVRLNGLPLSAASKTPKDLSQFPIKLPSSNNKFIKLVAPSALKSTTQLTRNVPNQAIIPPLPTPAELSLSSSGTGLNPDTLANTISSEIPLIMPKDMNATEPIKEEINLGAILMDDDECL